MRIWAGNLLPKFHLEQTLRTMMSPPLFPIEVESFKANIEYNDFHAGDTIDRGDGITLRTAMLNHPDGATGYRIEFGGPGPGLPDRHRAAGRPDRSLVCWRSRATPI